MTRNIRNRSVAVVGGAGFLGSHLVDQLIDDRNCDVLVIDNLVTGRLEFIRRHLDSRKAKFEHCDITGSEAFIRGLFHQYHIAFVFNYSAWPYVPTSIERPNAVGMVNYMGAMQVINAAQEAGVEAILQVSSAEIYGAGGEYQRNWEAAIAKGMQPEKDYSGIVLEEEKLKMTEEFPVCPHSSYGVAKAAVDAAVQVRWREARTPCIALRQFNCVGPRETHPYIVPEIIRQISSQMGEMSGAEFMKRGGDIVKGVTVHLGNNSFRDFLYAGDQARIATELLERGQFGEVYNLGSETGIKMYDLAKLIGKLMGVGEVQVIQDISRVRPWEIWHLQSDNSKIRSVLATDSKYPYGSAHPSTSQLDCLVPLEEALKRTITYYRENNNKWCWE